MFILHWDFQVQGFRVKSTSPDKLDRYWPETDSQYNAGALLRGQYLGGSGNGVFDAIGDLREKETEQKYAFRYLIVGDLDVKGPDDFTRFNLVGWGGVREAPGGSAFYTVLGIDKVANDIENRTGAEIRRGDYDGETQYPTAPERDMTSGCHLITEEEFALRSELGELIRMARIA